MKNSIKDGLIRAIRINYNVTVTKPKEMFQYYEREFEFVEWKNKEDVAVSLFCNDYDKHVTAWAFEEIVYLIDDEKVIRHMQEEGRAFVIEVEGSYFVLPGKNFSKKFIEGRLS